MNLDFKPLFKSSMLLNIEKNKIVRDSDLNLLVDRGFDLNKFIKEGEKVFKEKNNQKVVSTLMINTIGLYTNFGGK